MPMGSFGMGSGSGNVYADMKARYGYAPVDFTERPRVAGYPMETVPQSPDPPFRKTWFGRLIRRLID